jgi:hypothetical protein
MKKYLLFPTLLAVTALTILIYGCKKDDNGTGPNNSGGHQVNIQFHAGDQFVYNRWNLDSLNSKIASSKRGYRVDIKKGSSIIGGYTDWFYRIGMDSATYQKDTLYIRTETRTKADNSSFTKELQVYGFRTKLLKTFVAAIIAKVPTAVPPNIASETWDPIAKYFETDGTPVTVGTQWFLGPTDGEDLGFMISGYPVTIKATISCKYEAKDEPFTVGSNQILKWRNTINATFVATAFSLNIPVSMSFSFSDVPDGPIAVSQQSVQFPALVVIPAFYVPGEIQELVWYQQN